MDHIQAERFFTGEEWITGQTFSLLPELEYYFFWKYQFTPDFIIKCYPAELRRFCVNAEKTLYYFSPTIPNPRFIMRETRFIEQAEVVVIDAGNKALTGALLFGVTGAVVGSSMKKAMIVVRLHTLDGREPYVDIPILPIVQSQNSHIFNWSMNAANSICGYLWQLIKARSFEANAGAPVSAADEVRKLKELLDEGIITIEEFETKKKQLLRI